MRLQPVAQGRRDEAAARAAADQNHFRFRDQLPERREIIDGENRRVGQAPGEDRLRYHNHRALVAPLANREAAVAIAGDHLQPLGHHGGDIHRRYPAPAP